MENLGADPFASGAAVGMAVGPEQAHHGGMRVLVVEEDLAYLSTLTQGLQFHGYQVTAMASHEEGLSALQANPEGFDLVMTTVRTQGPGIDGFQLLNHAAKLYPVLMFSDFEPTAVMMSAMTGGACGFVTKPLAEDVVRDVWHHVIRRRFSEGSAAADPVTVVVVPQQDDTASAALKRGAAAVLDGSGERRNRGRPRKNTGFNTSAEADQHAAFVRAAEQLRGTEAMEIDELKEGSRRAYPSSLGS